MLFNLKKFSRQIQLLKSLNNAESPQPLILAQIKQRVLAAITEPQTEAKAALSLPEHGRRVLKYLIPSLLTLGLCAGTAFASTAALPGNLLYPIKKATEKVQLTLAVNPRARAELKSKFAQERLNELIKLKVAANKPQGHPSDSAKQENKPAVDPDGLIRFQAENNAKADVADALESLRQVKTSLEAKGNSQAAAQVRENIKKLKIKARDENLFGAELNLNNDDEKTETHDSQQKTDKPQVEGAATININVIAPATQTRDTNLLLPNELPAGQQSVEKDNGKPESNGNINEGQENQRHSDSEGDFNWSR